MAVKSNAVFRFTDYAVGDDGVRLHFVCADPGAGEASDYYVLLTFADVQGLTDLASFNTLVMTRLQRNVRAQGIASKLDALISRTVTI